MAYINSNTVSKCVHIQKQPGFNLGIDKISILFKVYDSLIDYVTAQ